MKRCLGFVATATSALLVACAHQPQTIGVNVDAIADPNVEAGRGSYVLVPSDPKLINDLTFKYYAYQVNTALQQTGRQVAMDARTAQVLITVSYGVSGPQVQNYTYSVPTFGVTGYSSSQTTGYVNSNGYYSANTVNTPQYGITGYQQATGTNIWYGHSLKLTAFDYPKFVAGQSVELWHVSALSVNGSSDLKAVFPYLLRGATQYIGATTPQTMNFKFPLPRGH